MLEPTKIYLFIFGLFTIVGGFMGYLNKGSMASLIAGGISGLLLLASGYLIMSGKAQPGLILGLVVSIALAGRFLPIFLKTHSLMPAGTTSIMAVICIVLTILSLVKK